MNVKNLHNSDIIIIGRDLCKCYVRNLKLNKLFRFRYFEHEVRELKSASTFIKYI